MIRGIIAVADERGVGFRVSLSDYARPTFGASQALWCAAGGDYACRRKVGEFSQAKLCKPTNAFASRLMPTCLWPTASRSNYCCKGELWADGQDARARTKFHCVATFCGMVRRVGLCQKWNRPRPSRQTVINDTKTDADQTSDDPADSMAAEVSATAAE